MKRIAIHSVPRSGSSWLGQILNSSPNVVYRFQPLFSYAFKDYLNNKSSQNEIINFFNKISQSNDDFLTQSSKIDSGEYPKFKKNNEFSHVVYKEVRYHHILDNLLKKDKELIVIGLIRSPFAVISSFLNSPREFRKDLGWNEIEEWRFAIKKNQFRKEEFYGYNKWKEVFFLFNNLSHKYPEQFKIVWYDKLLSNKIKYAKEIFSFCDLDFNNQTHNFIENTDHNDGVYSVFKNKLDDFKWKSNLNKKIISQITEDLYQEKIYNLFNKHIL